jgi:hypothetical protein
VAERILSIVNASTEIHIQELIDAGAGGHRSG